jgi:hypothetical protein
MCCTTETEAKLGYTVNYISPISVTITVERYQNVKVHLSATLAGSFPLNHASAQMNIVMQKVEVLPSPLDVKVCPL